jgi:hypothetical protein
MPPRLSYQPDTISLEESDFIAIYCCRQQQNILGLRVKFRHFSPVLTTFGISRHIFMKVLSINFHGNPPSGSRANTVHGDERTSMTQLTGAFHDNANAPNSEPESVSPRLKRRGYSMYRLA